MSFLVRCRRNRLKAHPFAPNSLATSTSAPSPRCPPLACALLRHNHRAQSAVRSRRKIRRTRCRADHRLRIGTAPTPIIRDRAVLTRIALAHRMQPATGGSANRPLPISRHDTSRGGPTATPYRTLSRVSSICLYKIHSIAAAGNRTIVVDRRPIFGLSDPDLSGCQTLSWNMRISSQKAREGTRTVMVATAVVVPAM